MFISLEIKQTNESVYSVIFTLNLQDYPVIGYLVNIGRTGTGLSG